MSKIVTGVNLPQDLQDVLTKYGLPKRCISFKLECAGCAEPIKFEYKCYVETSDAKLPLRTETRKYKLLLIE